MLHKYNMNHESNFKMALEYFRIKFNKLLKTLTKVLQKHPCQI